MNSYKINFLIGLILFGPFLLKAQSDKAAPLFIQDDLKLVSSDFSFTEGCSVDKKGNVFFTDQPNDKIWKYNTADGQLSVFLDKSGRANGTYFDKKGNLITCADDQGQLWSVSPSGKVKVLLNSKPGKQFNGPNDIWIHPNGGMYFTDPYYQRDYWKRTGPDLETEDVYYLPKGSDNIKIVAAGMVKPNGIVGTPDGKHLYVADNKGSKTYRFRIEKNGDLSSKELLIDRGSDGMTLDEQGRLYLTGSGGVFIYSPDGKLLDQIKVAGIPTNVCFYGKSRDQLFITARKAIYVIKMRTRGIE
jgi:gluconolactonase